jgi:hypothetical protein
MLRLTNPSSMQGVEAMLTIDCPWCDGPVAIEEDALECAGCAVRVEIAPDPAPIRLDAAA